jgi:predicted RND superfamily exporter protein
MFAYGVGPGVMFSYISSRNVRSLLIGTILAIALIALTLIVALKSWRFGLLSLLPKLVPGAMAFGLWGLVVGEINLALSIVSGMCIGIVVDDAVHFLSKYLRARREQGLSPEDAVRYAFKTVGTALIVTSIVLAAGFLVLAQSTFGFNGGMGKMSALIIAFALAADLLFLPPLIIWFESRGSKSSEVERIGNELAVVA